MRLIEYVVAEIDRDRSREVRFFGYRLGIVRVADRHGDSTITAYFVPEDEEA